MIRDPSDGSVKGINPAANEINTVTAKTPSEEITSGLPFGSTKPETIARLEKSREWLKNYHEEQHASRGNSNGSECTPAGHQGGQP